MDMKKLIAILVFGLIGFSSTTNAQNLTNEGVEFYVAFPEVYDNASAVFEINISSRTAATGSIEITGTGFNQLFNVVPNVVTTITIPPGDANITFSEVILERAIHVTTDVPVTVYASTFHLYRSEASVVLPVSSLGSSYMVTTYENKSVYQSEFIVIAGNIACDVTIIPSCNTELGVAAGTPIPVHLEPNEVYMVQAELGANDLTGTTIEATNGTDKFAVYNGHKWIYLGCASTTADPLYEVAYPCPSWGSEYIITLTADQSQNVYRVVAKTNGTSIQVDGVPVGPVLNVGEFYDGVLTNEAALITSTFPVAVTQSMVTGNCSTTATGDPSMVILNSNEQMYLDTVTFYAVAINGLDTNYCNVITRTTDINTVQLDGVPIVGWTALPADPQYSYNIFGIDTGSLTLTTTGCGFLAYTYGLQWAESYFYAAGTRVNAIDDSISFTNINTSIAGLCDLDSIQFTPFTSGGNVVSYDWDFGDGESSTEEDPLHTYDDAGTYTVELIVEYQCFTDTIIADITVFDSPLLTTNVTDVTCYQWGDGEVTSNVVDGTPGYDYLWSNGSTNPDITNIDGDDYWLVVTDQNGCQDSAFITVNEPPAIIVNIQPAGPYSPADGPQNLSASPGGGTWTASCGACINATTGVFDPLGLADGTYQVCYTATVGACDSTECIDILVSTSCAMVAFGSDPTCFGFSDGSFTVNTSGGTGTINYVLTDDQGNAVNSGNSNTANNLTTGWYYINITDDVCTFVDSIFIDEPSQMTLDLTITDPLCNGFLTGLVVVDTVYNATGDYDEISFFWNPTPPGGNGVGANQFIDAGAGNYSLLINDDNGCSETVDFTIGEPTPLAFTELDFDPAYCRLFPYQSGNGVVYGAANGGTPDYDYEWLDVYTLQTSNNTTWGGRNPSLFKLTVTDNNGCTLEGFIELDSLSPEAAFNTTSQQFLDPLVCEGTAILDAHFVNQSQYFANPNNPQADTTFFWHFGLPNDIWELSMDYYEEFDRSYIDSGTYDICLVALNKNGCSDTACKTIVVFEQPQLTLPNVFTPGIDGANDQFFFPNAAITEFEAVIVNRWGVTIFEYDDINDSWDGSDKSGSECKDGMYFYTYKALSTNGTAFEGQGNVTLIREK
ncbi:MAG: gliding motility-associated-like protein [Arenicella sp.]|jgi:gliding motility-associated-like protein